MSIAKTLIFYLHPAWQQARAAAEAEAKRIAEEERARQEVLRIQQEEEAKRKAQEEVRLTSYFPYLWMLSAIAPMYNQCEYQDISNICSAVPLKQSFLLISIFLIGTGIYYYASLFQ